VLERCDMHRRYQRPDIFDRKGGFCGNAIRGKEFIDCRSQKLTVDEELEWCRLLRLQQTVDKRGESIATKDCSVVSLGCAAVEGLFVLTGGDKDGTSVRRRLEITVSTGELNANLRCRTRILYIVCCRHLETTELTSEQSNRKSSSRICPWRSSHPEWFRIVT